MTVYTIHLIYLIYTISAGIGPQVINIILAALTVAFMAVYLVLRLSGRRKAKEIKQIKRYYKSVRLIGKAINSITAVYSLIVAFATVSPFALIVALLGAVFVIIKLIVDALSYYIQRKLRRLTEGLASRLRRSQGEAQAEVEEDNDSEPERRVKRRKRRKGEVPKFVEDLEEKILPLEDSLLIDIEKL